MRGVWSQFLHALLLCVLRTIGAIKELPLEQLDGDDSKDEHKELVDNEYVEDVLQGGHHAVKHSLWTVVKALVSFLGQLRQGHATTQQAEKLSQELSATKQ